MMERTLAVASPSFSQDPDLCWSLRAQIPPKWQLRFWRGNGELRGHDLAQFLQASSVAIIGKELINPALLGAVPSLRAIAKYGVGLDNIDFAACEQAGVRVYYQGGVNAEAVAEQSIGLMLCLLRKISCGDRRIRQGLWRKDGGRQLSGSRVAIIGCGAVGSAVARLLAAFRCQLLLCDLVDKSALAQELGGTLCGFQAAVQAAQVVSLHVPLTPATTGLINRQSLQWFPPQSILINTSRGKVVDLEALKQALAAGLLGGAGLDVFPEEPLVDPELCAFDQVVLTPHSAGNAKEAVLAMGKAAIQGAMEYVLPEAQ